MSPDRLNYGWMPRVAFLRRFQFIWWGFGWWLGDPMHRNPFYYARCTGGLATVYRWTLVIGPVEVRRWSDR